MIYIISILVLIWLFAEGITEAYRTKAKDMEPYGLDFHSWRIIHRWSVSLTLIILSGFPVGMFGLLLFGNFMVYERSRSKFDNGVWFAHWNSYKHYRIKGITLKWTNKMEVVVAIIGLIMLILDIAL